jgi:hypothetical protein
MLPIKLLPDAIKARSIVSCHHLKTGGVGCLSRKIAFFISTRERDWRTA